MFDWNFLLFVVALIVVLSLEWFRRNAQTDELLKWKQTANGNYQRKLGILEKLFWKMARLYGGDMTIVWYVENPIIHPFRYLQVEGKLPPEIIRESLKDVQQAHPLLRSKVVKTPVSLYFECTEQIGDIFVVLLLLTLAEIPVQLISNISSFTESNSDIFLTLAEQVIESTRTPLPPDGPLMKLTYVTDTNRHHFFFIIDHCIADGISTLHVSKKTLLCLFFICSIYF